MKPLHFLLVTGLSLMALGASPVSAQSPNSPEIQSLETIEDLMWQGAQASMFGEYSKAEALLRQALALEPKDLLDRLAILNNLGNAVSGQGRYAEAELYYRQAMQLAPEDWLAASSLVNMYLKQSNHYQREERYDEAEAVLMRIQEFDSDRMNQALAELYSFQGARYRDQGRYEEAEATLLKGLELENPPALSYASLGNFYHLRDRYEESIAAYEQALKLDPNNSNIRWGLENVLHDLQWRDRSSP